MKYNYLYLIAFLILLMAIIKFLLPILIYLIPILLIVSIIRNYKNKKEQTEENYEYTYSTNETSHGDVIDVEYSVVDEEVL